MKTLERIVIPPQKKPTGSVIWLHGLGADGNDFIDIVSDLRLPKELHVRFVLPHAPIRAVTVNQNLPMRAWYNIYSFEDLDQEDIDGIVDMQTAIHALIQEEIDQGIPSHRIVLAGFSQGGAMALRAGLCHTEPLGGILALSTYLPLPHQLHQDRASKQAPPIFIGHGRFDPVLPIILGQACYKQLQHLGYSIEWHDYPMEHQLCDEELQDISRWLTHRFA